MKIAGLCVSPGHNFFGHHGRPPGEHPLVPVEEVECVAGRGLRGDRFFDYKPDYAGQVTFFALETHEALGRELGLTPYSPAHYRRNVLTREADLNALAGREFAVQGVRFFGVAECKPCYWMDRAAGPGAEAWLRGRGGLRARILSDGRLRLDDDVAAGLLLVGGRSRRMGRDKAALEWAGRPLSEHQAATLAASRAWPVIVACRPDQASVPDGCARLEDRTEDGGPLAVLAAVWSSTRAAAVTALAVDLPFVPSAFLASLACEAQAAGLSVVPVCAGRFEPLAAAWHRSAGPALQRAVEDGASLQQVCAALAAAGRLRPHPLQPDEVPWMANLNTVEDWQRAALIAAKPQS